MTHFSQQLSTTSRHLAFGLLVLFTHASAQQPATSPAAPPRPNFQRPQLPNAAQLPRPGVTNPNTIPPPGAPRPSAVPPAIPSAVAPTPTPATTIAPPGTLPSSPSATPSAPKPPPVPPATPATAVKPGEEKFVVAFPAVPISEVLEEYYDKTGRRVLKDRGLENATVSIEVPGEFTKAEYQDIIEKGLLMHGYALVPSGDNLYKLVAAETGSSPSQQNVPMILRAAELPQTDTVVMHVIQLSYLNADEAATAIQSAIPPHPYGKIVAVPNARSLVVTEASQTIRAYLELIKQLDLAPSQTIQKTIHLERTDPEDMAKMLESLLGLKNEGTGSTPRPNTPPAAPRAPATPGIPGGVAPQAAQQASAVVSATGGGLTAEGPKPILQPLPRISSLLVIARPLDLEQIEKLVAEIDSEAKSKKFVSRKLNYIDLSTFLGLAEKALMRNDKNAKSSTTGGTGQTTPTGGNQSAFGNNSSGFGNSGFGNSGFGSSGFGSSGFGSGGLGGSMGGGGFGGGGGGSTQPLEVTKKAISALIGNTLVIADPASSKFFASGPPDQLTLLQELAEELDVRPRQIMISVIIGRFNLKNDFKFGLDWINSLRNIGGGQQAGGVIDGGAGTFDPTDLNSFTKLAAAGSASTLGGLTAYGQIAKNLHVFMNAVESSGRFKVLQKPVVTTLNHQLATIYIGEQIAIAGQTFNGGNGFGQTSTTQFIPVRLQLDITPHIFNEKEILLEFKQQNNSTNGFTTVNGNDVPNIAEQGMSNSLIVPDRTVAMLGGLISESNTKGSSGVPFLVRLPLIKYLFGNTANKDERSELMIFVQPHIMPEGAAHIHEQTRFFNNSTNTNDVFEFAGYPEEPLPPMSSQPAQPNFYPNQPVPQVQQPALTAPTQDKPGVWSKFKGLFRRQNQDP